MLKETEFLEAWHDFNRPKSTFQFLNKLVRSEALEIQDLEVNTPRGLVIMSELHQANLQMKYYDLLNFKFKEFIQESVKQESKFSVLEIGTGHGYVITNIAKFLSKYYTNASFFGLDINQDFLRFARSNCENEGELVTFFHGDANKLNINLDQNFDYVLMSIFTHHLKPYELYTLIVSIIPHVNKGIFIMDVRRNFLDIFKSKLMSFINFSYSKDFKHDALLSMRRAYTVSELKWVFGLVPGLSNCIFEHLGDVFLMVKGTIE